MRHPFPANPLIAIIEDNDQKYEDVARVLRRVCNAMPHRASNAVDAERLLMRFSADLVILDISMGISKGSSTKTRQGFANLGGIDILDSLYYVGRSFPTIIVTGFDMFESEKRSSTDYDIVGLDQICDIAKSKLGSDFVGCVRYESFGWEDSLAILIEKWAAQ